MPGFGSFSLGRRRVPDPVNARSRRHGRDIDTAAGAPPITITTVPENHLILVQSDAGEQQWTLTTARRHRDWLLTITTPDHMNWSAEGPDLFKALRELRRALDPLGIRLGVNGARRDAWASGMQCDMGEGRVVYLLAEGRADRPEQVSTLGQTAVEHVGTLEEQDQHHARWLISRGTVS